MKHLVYLFLFLWTMGVQAQEKSTIEPEDLKMPVSPGFGLLDLSPTSIERPANPKTLSLTMLNFTGSGNTLPKNFALEISPYWLVKHDNETIFKFLGISKTNGETDLSTGFLRKMTLSAATYFNDSAKNFLPNTNYTAFGARTNILTFWGNKRGNQVREILAVRNKERALVLNAFPMLDDPDEIQKKVDSVRKRQDKEEKKISGIKPLASLDAAYAYSDAYYENNYDNRRFNRSAFWINGTVNICADKEYQHYLFAIVNVRSMQDNILTDTTLQVFHKEVSTDWGLRIGYETGDVTISVEHLSRKYRDVASMDSKRTVGILQYKINDNISLFGTFGKNFGEANNLFTLLGINWGWGKKSLPAQ